MSVVRVVNVCHDCRRIVTYERPIPKWAAYNNAWLCDVCATLREAYDHVTTESR